MSSSEQRSPVTRTVKCDDRDNDVDAQAPLILDGDPNATDNKADSGVSTHVEWIPIMMRPLPAILLASYCIGLILGLELLNDLPSTRHGIPMTHKTAAEMITYLPTVFVVLLGILWKRLIVDLKRITPWAQLSHSWTLGKDSLELNYLDDLELSLLWPAIKRRHWALLVGLLGGLIAGGLVPLAAALTFVDLAGQSTRTVLVHHDVFNFDNTLRDSNASLSLLKSFRGGAPWAGAANVLQADGNPPAWTTDSFVFAPFRAGITEAFNHTLTANTTAITGRLICEALQVDTSVDREGSGTLTFNVPISTDSSINVNLTWTDAQNHSTQTVLKDPDTFDDPPVTWLNMSTAPMSWMNYTSPAAPSAMKPILITLLQPSQDADSHMYFNGTVDGRLVPVRTYRGVGLSCTPSLYTYSALVSVNASNQIVTSYTLENTTLSSVDIGIPSELIIGYLNNPLHPDTIFGESGLRNMIRVQDVVSLGHTGNYLPNFYTAYSGSDPFGTQLLDLDIRPVEAYFDDHSLLEVDASRVFATIMTQIIKAFAVTNGTEESLGEIGYVEPLLKVQQAILRALEVCLAVLAIIVLCCAWPLRPRTCLSQDPSSLHFIANSLARNKALDMIFSRHKKSAQNLCRDSHFRLRQEAGPGMHIDIASAGLHDPLTVPHKKKTHEPIQLRQLARLGLLLIVIMYIVALCVVYVCGVQRGYATDTRETQIAWSFVPTTLLVLIGYAVSGTISAAQAIAPLAMLKTNRISGRRVMRFSPRNRSELTLPYHSLLRLAYLPVLLTALIALIYPAIKVVAADMFQAFESPQLRDCAVQLSPPVFDFAQLARTDGGTESRLRNTAAIRTDWVQLPDFGVQSQPNVVRNLVFQNVSVSTGDERFDGRLATLELTALAVNMTCETFADDVFDLKVWHGRFGLTFWFDCKTANCRSKMPNTTKTELDDEASPHIAQQFANWTEFYTDPYDDANRRFYGSAGNLFTTPAVQVFIADFASIAGPVSNHSFIPEVPTFVRPAAGMFNVSMPTIRGVSCLPVLQNVRVNATIEKRVQAGLDGQSTILPWAVTDFDPSSLTVVNDLNISDPQVWRKMFPKGTLWGFSPFINRDRTLVNTNWTNESELNDDDIRPASGIASNFFELLASYERSQGREATSVLDVEELASATIAVYGLYNAELLSHFRITNSSTEEGSREVTRAQLHTLQARVKPNPHTTFAVIGMLSAVLVLLLITFLTTASEGILLDEPGKISTQLSLFAGSKIVERLREEESDAVWDEKFSLGWWKTQGPDEEDLRWGIDIGKLDATLQGYESLHPRKKHTWLSSMKTFCGGKFMQKR